MTLMQENRHEILYFAYGSNLSTDQMRERCPYSTPVGLGYLQGWRWFINQRGFANIIQIDESDSDDDSSSSTDKGKAPASTVKDDGVYGLLYLLPPEDEQLLDHYEGVPYAYQKFQVDLMLEKDAVGDFIGEMQTALIYIDTERVDEDDPRQEYIGRMERGIEDAVQNWGMDEEYANRVMRRFWKEKQ